MINNHTVVEQLCVEHHDTLVELSHSICGDVCNCSEDMVQDLYLDLLESDELLDYAVDNEGCIRDGFIYFTLKSKLNDIIKARCLVVSENCCNITL